MRSREEVEAEVRKKIENLSNVQRKERYHLVKPAGADFSTIELRTDEEAYPNMDVEGHKQHLLGNFPETVRLIVAREISQLVVILSEAEKLEKVPQIGNKGIGDVCNFTIQDIRDLKLDDPYYVKDHMEEIQQGLFEAYGYDEKLPTSMDISKKRSEHIKALQEGAKKSEALKIEKQIALMKHAIGDGEFTLDGLPLELRADCEKRFDEKIKQAEREEAEEQKVSGQELGQETLGEQKDTDAKTAAMRNLTALRMREQESDKQQ